MTTKKTIYIIRHGQTDFNLRGIVQGRGVDSDLNETGRVQALAFYNKYREVAFDHIFTSTLKRTIQSVEQFIIDGIPHTTLHALDEINWGVFEGKETTPDSKAAFNQIIESWRNGALDQPIEGGESPRQMYDRQKEGWQQIIESQHQNILVCMHGRAMRSFLSLILDTPLQDMDQYGHTNLCLYKLEHNEGVINVVLQNDTSHYEG